MGELREGLWYPDTDHPDEGPWPDEDQPGDVVKLLSLLRYFARNGEPPYKHSFNDLEDGIWEFKVSSKRFPMFDTDGAGLFSPKLRIGSIDEAVPGAEYWEFPEFDWNVRLTHCFPKSSQRTPRKEIDEAHRIRSEDIAHDTRN
ncbi:hypothetical protein P5G50_16290 [Leifsonia sp. F6_8S_P_1B]|uniref:Uncharacterized protein n=1 Tax=Leifsonia williamsii TaxID=3035919 RepID=A0ABT8KEY6_9MICO|nr:hypothetical protein [Leifsonia williamsii]MDN4616011.1 hypothetical protein [Leifsonia williamsii]